MTLKPKLWQFFYLETEKLDLNNQKVKILTLKPKFWHLFYLRRVKTNVKKKKGFSFCCCKLNIKKWNKKCEMSKLICRCIFRWENVYQLCWKRKNPGPIELPTGWQRPRINLHTDTHCHTHSLASTLINEIYFVTRILRLSR